MGYDLNFWRYKKGISLNHQEVYEKCSDEETVEGLEELPYDAILKDISEEFAGWKTENITDFENHDGKGAFVIMYTNQFFRFDCYGMEGEDMNRIIDIMHRYQCPLYDPQVTKRYD